LDLADYEVKEKRLPTVLIPTEEDDAYISKFFYKEELKEKAVEGWEKLLKLISLYTQYFLISLFMIEQKQKWARDKAYAVPFDKDLVKSFVAGLPFKLTDAQRKSAWQIFQDQIEAFALIESNILFEP